MEIAAIAVPMLVVPLLWAALRAGVPHATLPALFALMLASVSLGYVAAVHGRPLVGAVAAVGAGGAVVALSLAVWAHDSSLAMGAAPGSRAARWRRFEREFWAYVATHGARRADEGGDEALRS